MTTAPSASPSSLAANPVSSTQILVTWASVPRLEQNGQILGYKVSSVHGGGFVLLGWGVLLANQILDSQSAAESGQILKCMVGSAQVLCCLGGGGEGVLHSDLTTFPLRSCFIL